MSRRSSPAAEAFGLGKAMVNKMSTDHKECRAHGLLCSKRARTATTKDSWQLFLDLANSWNRMAADEAAESFISAMKDINA
jgi:hypothetical protein